MSKNIYFSTFISGTQEIIKYALEENLQDVKISLLLDGLVVYETSSDYMYVSNLRFLNNSFVLFMQYNQSLNPSIIIKRFLLNPILPSLKLKNINSFRIIASYENELQPLDKNLL